MTSAPSRRRRSLPLTMADRRLLDGVGIVEDDVGGPAGPESTGGGDVRRHVEHGGRAGLAVGVAAVPGPGEPANADPLRPREEPLIRNVRRATAGSGAGELAIDEHEAE